MNLLFCINQSFRPLLCQCLRSIVKNGGEEAYDAYILHSDLTEEDFGAIEAVSDRVHCRFVAVNARDFEGFPESSSPTASAAILALTIVRSGNSPGCPQANNSVVPSASWSPMRL